MNDKQRGDILVITDNYPPAKGGIARIVHLLCSCLPPHRLAVLAPECEGASAFDATQSYRVDRVRFRTGGLVRTVPSVLRFLAVTLRTCTRSRISTLVLASAWPLGPVGLVAGLRGLPYAVCTYGNDFLRPRSAGIGWLRLKVLRRAAMVLTISEFSRRELVRIGVNAERIRLLPCCVDAARFSLDFDVNAFRETEGLAGKKVLLTVGRLVERKGVDRVIASLPAILRDHPDAVYVVVGNGPDRSRIEELARREGVAEKVLFKYERSDEDVVKFLHACDVFVMVSRYIKEQGDVEGFGIVYIEANACGKPVVGGRSGGVPDAVADGETGLLVDPDDVPEISAALGRLLADDTLRRRLGEQGYDRVSREFSRENYTKNLLAHLSELPDVDLS